MKLEFITCKHCERTFGLAAGTGKLSVESLPDPFEAKCPHCYASQAVEKADLETIGLGSRLA